jgi:hypothetical protein
LNDVNRPQITGNAHTARPAPAIAASAMRRSVDRPFMPRARRSRNIRYETASVIDISTTANDAP